MRIPFVGPSYTARSLNVNAQRAVNCYLEFDNASPRAPAALYGTPGLRLRATLGASPVRGVIRQGAFSYWVAGSTVYRMNAAYATASLGSIGSITGEVGMASNGTQVLIVDGVSGWLISGGVLTQITDPDFPAGVTRATYQDGFFIVAGDGSQSIYINETPNAGSAWNGTDFASAEGSPDDAVTVISDHRELWVFGTESAEVWINTGNPDFPFERNGNTFIEQGTIAAGSVASMDNTVFWLGGNRNGDGIVFRAQGYQPARISNHAMETTLRGYSDLSDAFAYCYQLDGHSFYVLTFPTANRTWVYDASTNEWHEWLWRDPATNLLHRHRSNCHVFIHGEHLVGDWESGKVYGLDPDFYMDGADPIKRIRTTQTLSADGKSLFFEELLIHMETGVGTTTGQGSNPQLMLRYSNDGGHTWSNEKTKSIGASGDYKARVKFGPTGMGKDRVWEISMTDPVKWVVYGADARASKEI